MDAVTRDTVREVDRQRRGVFLGSLAALSAFFGLFALGGLAVLLGLAAVRARLGFGGLLVCAIVRDVVLGALILGVECEALHLDFLRRLFRVQLDEEL